MMYQPDGSKNPAYWRDENLQARFRQLLDAQDKMAARAA